MPGARCARSLVCKVESTRVSHHGHTGFTRHSPRNGFNGLYRALPGDRAFLPPSSADIAFRRLDTSVGASGPHDFAVRLKRRSSFGTIGVHRIPPHVRDDRETPPCWGGMASDIDLIWGRGEAENFLKWDWTGGIILIRFNKFRRARKSKRAGSYASRDYAEPVIGPRLARTRWAQSALPR